MITLGRSLGLNSSISFKVIRVTSSSDRTDCNDDSNVPKRIAFLTDGVRFGRFTASAGRANRFRKSMTLQAKAPARTRSLSRSVESTYPPRTQKATTEKIV